jgi:hypothetical protein
MVDGIEMQLEALAAIRAITLQDEIAHAGELARDAEPHVRVVAREPSSMSLRKYPTVSGSPWRVTLSSVHAGVSARACAARARCAPGVRSAH